MDERIRELLRPDALARWMDAQGLPGTGEPLDARFISGGARFWAGAFAGSSRILVKMKLTDQDTGQGIAEGPSTGSGRQAKASWRLKTPARSC